MQSQEQKLTKKLLDQEPPQPPKKAEILDSECNLVITDDGVLPPTDTVLQPPQHMMASLFPEHDYSFDMDIGHSVHTKNVNMHMLQPPQQHFQQSLNQVAKVNLKPATLWDKLLSFL